jgi:hypothetical protein
VVRVWCLGDETNLADALLTEVLGEEDGVVGDNHLLVTDLNVVDVRAFRPR